MKYEIRDRGVVATISYFVNNSHTSYKFFQFMEQIWFGDCLLCVRIKRC